MKDSGFVNPSERFSRDGLDLVLIRFKSIEKGFQTVAAAAVAACGFIKSSVQDVDSLRSEPVSISY